MCPSEEPPNLTQDEILVIVMEEAAEVIKEAAKCIRSGLHYVPHKEEGGTLTNIEKLSIELGDLLGMCDKLPVDQAALDCARTSKMLRARRAKKLYGRTL